MASRIHASLLTACLVALLPASAFAATITLNEAGTETLLEETQGAETIDIDLRFNASVTINNAALLSIDSAAELAALWALAPVASPTVTMFFVDSLNWCAGSQPSAVGCAVQGGTTLVLESAVAAGVNGAELAAHELGHTYGLPHLEDPTNNIMNCCDWGNTAWTEGQLTTINASALVQLDGSIQFTDITPVLITPEPGTLSLSLLGLVGIGWRAGSPRRGVGRPQGKRGAR
jgi:hypothetical protein